MRTGYNSAILFSAILLVALLFTTSNASTLPESDGLPEPNTGAFPPTLKKSDDCIYGAKIDGTCKDLSYLEQHQNSRVRLTRREYTTASTNDYNNENNSNDSYTSTNYSTDKKRSSGNKRRGGGKGSSKKRGGGKGSYGGDNSNDYSNDEDSITTGKYTTTESAY
jgi:uncharacterized membrane protein YgcG